MLSDDALHRASTSSGREREREIMCLLETKGSSCKKSQPKLRDDALHRASTSSGGEDSDQIAHPVAGVL